MGTNLKTPCFHLQGATSFSIKGLFIRDTEHKLHSAWQLSAIILSDTFYAYCRFAQCHYADCHGAIRDALTLKDVFPLSKFSVITPSTLTCDRERIITIFVTSPKVAKGSFSLVMFFTAILPVTATRNSHYLLALATLSDLTQIGSFLFMSCRPRWPRQVQVCCCCMSLSLALSHGCG